MHEQPLRERIEDAMRAPSPYENAQDDTALIDAIRAFNRESGIRFREGFDRMMADIARVEGDDWGDMLPTDPPPPPFPVICPDCHHDETACLCDQLRAWSEEEHAVYCDVCGKECNADFAITDDFFNYCGDSCYRVALAEWDQTIYRP